MIIPENITIGKSRWTIVRSVLGDDELGKCEFKNNRILLNPDINTDSEKSVLMHEILHAIWANYGLPDDVEITEEIFVEALDTPLYEFIIDNPEFIEYLKGEKKRTRGPNRKKPIGFNSK